MHYPPHYLDGVWLSCGLPVNVEYHISLRDIDMHPLNDYYVARTLTFPTTATLAGPSSKMNVLPGWGAWYSSPGSQLMLTALVVSFMHTFETLLILGLDVLAVNTASIILSCVPCS